LNHDFAKTGVVPILRLMSVTLPLLRALDQITSTGQPGSPVVHVIVRSPSTFQIRYPRLKAQFQLFPHLNRGHLKWGLRNANRSKPADDNPVASTIREKLYNSKGDGWNGLGDGAVADMGKVGVLLVELNNVARQLELSGASLEEGGNDQSSIVQSTAKEQHPAKDSVGARAPPGKAPGAHANQDPKLNAGGMGSADIITID
jgi:mediator of RNA polymerase II transcription subunit 14